MTNDLPQPDKVRDLFRITLEVKRKDGHVSNVAIQAVKPVKEKEKHRQLVEIYRNH